MRTVPVQIVCRNCANPYRTTVRGGNTRCPHCRTSRHVRIDQPWEGPVPSGLSGAAGRAAQAATRPPVWVECRCGHEWQSRARDRMTIRCPECGTGQRVPYRTDANTGPAPEGYRPPAPAPRPRTHRPAPAWEPYEEPDVQPEPLRLFAPSSGQRGPSPAVPPGGPLGGLAGILAALGGRRTQSAPPSAPAPRPAAPARPAVLAPVTAAAPVEPIDPQQLPARELRRRDDVCQMSRSLSGTFTVWYNQPPGLCEALDTTQPRERQRCASTATHAVRFVRDVTQADAYTCPVHARPLAAIADHAPYITAAVYSLR